ncbi:hypothetical protein A0H81_12062 [Grifola frondosa]|uniref:Uncharacterized protein n=1 Tax=Grifola frondosa TaxID=5627 RepID=A0A1C7LT75_GRIFR|nr:hypothetical protein A0H81_12062 [Grifola frondosa]
MQSITLTANIDDGTTAAMIAKASLFLALQASVVAIASPSPTIPIQVAFLVSSCGAMYYIHGMPRIMTGTILICIAADRKFFLDVAVLSVVLVGAMLSQWSKEFRGAVNRACAWAESNIQSAYSACRAI